MGPNLDIEDLDFGPPEELQHAEALLLSATLGLVAAARLASNHLGSSQGLARGGYLSSGFNCT